MLGNFEGFSLSKQLIESTTKKRRSQNKKTGKNAGGDVIAGGNVTQFVSLNRGADRHFPSPIAVVSNITVLLSIRYRVFYRFTLYLIRSYHSIVR
jgi:hypothetical protein